MALAPTPGGSTGDTSSLARPGYKGKRRTTDYERQIAHALMRKGKSKSQAIAMARGLLNKAAGSGRWGNKGKASGPVRAGAAASIAQRASFSNVEASDVQLARGSGRYRHGWVKIGPGSNDGMGKAAQHGPAGYETRNVMGPIKAAVDAEIIRRHKAAMPPGKPVPTVSKSRDAKVVKRGKVKPPSPRARYAAKRVRVEAQRRGIKIGRPAGGASVATYDPSFSYAGGGVVDLAARWKHGWVPLNAEALAIVKAREKARMSRYGTSAPAGVDIKAKAAKLDTPVSKYGLRHDADIETHPAVAAAHNADWSKARKEHVKISDLTARESHVQSSHIDKVVSGAEPLRDGYNPKILVLNDGRKVVMDGHTRAAMHGGMGSATMRADVIHERDLKVASRSGSKIKRDRAKVLLAEKPLTLRNATDHEAHTHAITIHERARQAEPEVTSTLKSVVTNVGGEFDSLKDTADEDGDFRFKTLESMTRKIRDKAHSKGVSQSEYASQIGDALRYTTILPKERMTEGAEKIIKEFERKGFKLNDINNSWRDRNSYSGLNMVFERADGFKWELQVHTPESIAIKKKAHHYYDIVREPKKYSERERKLAYTKMVALWEEMPRPAGWQRLGDSVRREPELHDDRLIGAAVRRERRKRKVPVQLVS